MGQHVPRALGPLLPQRLWRRARKEPFFSSSLVPVFAAMALYAARLYLTGPRRYLSLWRCMLLDSILSFLCSDSYKLTGP